MMSAVKQADTGIAYSLLYGFAKCLLGLFNRVPVLPSFDVLVETHSLPLAAVHGSSL